MTKLTWLFWVALGLATQNLNSQSHAMEVVHFQSEAAATAAHANGHANPLSVWGHIGMPEGDGPFPAVVLLHGCAGLQPNNFRWASFLNRHGYLTLIMDSFGPRSLVRTCHHDLESEALSNRQLDTLGAHAYLISRPDVDRQRIGLMGWSHGATVALELVGKRST
ncbi:MAG: prolyl oligopeptidase family serine peptidase, partial [Pseudomonadota bacterium]